jgi:hypothetical protein
MGARAAGWEISCMESPITRRPTMTELAYRQNDGLSVALLWSRAKEHLTVAVSDDRTGESFELEAAPEKALDVFYHPYAYAASHGLGVADLLAERGPVYA